MSREREISSSSAYDIEEIGKKIKRENELAAGQIGIRQQSAAASAAGHGGPGGSGSGSTITTSSTTTTTPTTTLNTITPCAACKLLRRRCAEECPFSPYFSPHDPQKFAAVHKVFGASNVSKMLMEVPEIQRADAANSLVYEANVRLRDPVYGCMGAISALQHQVQLLQADLNSIRTQIFKYKYTNPNTNLVMPIISNSNSNLVSVAALPPSAANNIDLLHQTIPVLSAPPHNIQLSLPPPSVVILPSTTSSSSSSSPTLTISNSSFATNLDSSTHVLTPATTGSGYNNNNNISITGLPYFG